MQIYKILICLIAFELNSAAVMFSDNNKWLSNDLVDLFEQGYDQEIIDVLESNEKLLSLKTYVKGYSCLYLASLYNRVNILKYLMTKNIDVNEKNAFNESPLMIAAREGFVEIIKLLLKSTIIDINAKDNHLNNALMLAVENNHIEIVRLLMSQPGILLNEIDDWDKTLLIYAIYNYNIEMLKLLLNNININVNMTDKYGYTALHRAIDRLNKCENKLEIIKILLAHPNIKINTKDIYDHTILMSAAYSGDVEVMRLLLDCGEDMGINAKNSLGATALSYAAANNRIEAVKLLMKQSNIDINIKDNNGYTAAKRAKRNNYKLISKFIKGKIDSSKLSYKCKYNYTLGEYDLIGIITGHLNETFISWFKKDMTFEIICHLKKFPQLLSKTDYENRSIFELALIYNLPHLVSYLTSTQKIDINDWINGYLPLIIAANNNSMRVIRLLVNHPEIDINAKDKFGNTVLMVSANKGFIDAIKLLISIPGILVNEIDKLGYTALMRAAQSGDEEIVQLLLSYPDIKIDIKNKFGYTSLDKALFYQHKNIVELIHAYLKK